MNVFNPNHPIITSTTCKIVEITTILECTRLTPEGIESRFSDGTVLEKIRHKPKAFQFQRSKIKINWVVPENTSINAWYYSTS